MRGEKNIRVSPITGDAHVSLRLSGQLLWENLPLSHPLATAALKQGCLHPAVHQAHTLILHYHISPCVGLVLERNRKHPADVRYGMPFL